MELVVERVSELHTTLHREGVDTVFRVLAPMNADGWQVQPVRAYRIRRDTHGPSDHLPIDPTPEASSIFREIATAEGARARVQKKVRLTMADHERRREVVYSALQPIWSEEETLREQIGQTEGKNPSEVTFQDFAMRDRNRLVRKRRAVLSRVNKTAEGKAFLLKQKNYKDIIQRTRKNGISIENIDREQGIVSVVSFPVPYAAYAALSDPEYPTASQELGNAFAVGVGLVTIDNVLLIQRRSENDNIYPQMLGASTGGFSDGRHYQGHPGVNAPVTTATIKEDSSDELDWEIGLQEEDIREMKILTFVEDLRQIHTEAIVYVVTNLTYKEVKENAEIMALRDSPRPGHEFAERFFGVPATVETIETLLCDIPCPFPYSHIQSILGVGFMQKIKEGEGVAQAWLDQMYRKIEKNYKRINEMVKKYWEKNPEKSVEYAGDTQGYDPHFSPIIQGLPNPVQELLDRRVSLHL